MNKLTHCSEEIARFHGVTVEEYIDGFSIDNTEMAMVHPDELEEFGALIADAHANAKSYDTVYRALPPDGKVRYIREVGQPIFDNAGKFVRMIGSAQDITEQKRIEESLKESEAVFEQAARMAHLGHWVFDEKLNRLTTCSEEIGRIHGVTAEDYLAGFAIDGVEMGLVHPDDRAAFGALVADVHANAKSYDTVYRAMQPDGTIRHVREVGQPIFDESGEFVRMIGSAQDITERKEAEEELARKEAQLRAALDNMPGGMFMVDENLVIQVYNEQYKEMYDFPDETVREGVSLAEAVRARAERGDYGPGDPEELIEQRVQGYIERMTLRHEEELPNGRIIELLRTPVEGGGGVGIATDITERKRAEQELASVRP